MWLAVACGGLRWLDIYGKPQTAISNPLTSIMLLKDFNLLLLFLSPSFFILKYFNSLKVVFILTYLRLEVSDKL